MKYVILGASAAGVNCAKTLRQLEPSAQITIVSEDEQVHSRCMLHHYISGHKKEQELNFAGRDFFQKNAIEWQSGKSVKHLDIPGKQVLLEDGSIEAYDRLLIATGASSFIPPIENLREAKGVIGLRDLKDAKDIVEKLPEVKRVAVLGAGLVGVDAVSGLMAHDVQIDLVEMADHILPLQLDEVAARVYENAFRDQGVKIHTSVKAEKVCVDEKERVTGIELSNGATIKCEMIIVATGVRANTGFVPEGTLEIDRGITINEQCETNVPDIYAAGDVCARTPIWPIAVKQGITAAYAMTGADKALSDEFGLRNALNFMEIQTVSIGNFHEIDEGSNVYVRQGTGYYQKIVEKDGVVQGAILQGDIAYCGTLTHLIKHKISIAEIKKERFDIDYADFYKVNPEGAYEFAV